MIEALRSGIMDGAYAPGSRFLTQEEVMARWGIAKATVQRVFRVLTQDGYLVPRGAAGTFVAEFPPHQFHLALTFPFYADQLPLSRFYMGIGAEAANIARTGPWRITSYYGLETRQPSPDVPRLLADITAHRVGGLILIAPLFSVLATLPGPTPTFRWWGSPRHRMNCCRGCR